MSACSHWSDMCAPRSPPAGIPSSSVTHPPACSGYTTSCVTPSSPTSAVGFLVSTPQPIQPRPRSASTASSFRLHQDVGRMQLITRSAHGLAIPHTRGMSIWGGGYKAP
ncbi:HNH endonuclease [Archangium violaceum]|uniref:HNH endonuclease n=1 Tax=Archangium violaceum TaxID=83451 RepID=UPI000A050591|nr:HNH endonuclease [Archangium violaceum]